MKLKKAVIERALKEGAFGEITELMGGAFVLVEIAHILTDEAADRMERLGLRYGEIKHRFNGYERAFDLYHVLWNELSQQHRTAEGGAGSSERARTEDLAYFLPKVCRLLEVADLVTDPETGRPVEAVAPKGTDDTTDDRSYSRRERRRTFDLLERRAAQDGGQMRYDPPTMSEGQRRMLGSEVWLRCRTHRGLMIWYDGMARGTGRPKHDLINEALLRYFVTYDPEAEMQADAIEREVSAIRAARG